MIEITLGNNNIGVEGCEILSRSKWPNFSRLHLSTIPSYVDYNLITNEGLAYLQLADWPNLLEANLCIELCIKPIINWTLQA